MSYALIGRVFFMHHTTVLYHLRTVKKIKQPKVKPPEIQDGEPDLSGEWAI